MVVLFIRSSVTIATERDVLSIIQIRITFGDTRTQVTPYLWPNSGEKLHSTNPDPISHFQTRTDLSLRDKGRNSRDSVGGQVLKDSHLEPVTKTDDP